MQRWSVSLYSPQRLLYTPQLSFCLSRVGLFWRGNIAVGCLPVVAIGMTITMAGLNYPVAAVMALVNHINLASFSIAKHIEVVSHQLHLLQGLCQENGWHGKVLSAYDLTRQFRSALTY